MAEEVRVEFEPAIREHKCSLGCESEPPLGAIGECTPSGFGTEGLEQTLKAGRQLSGVTDPAHKPER